jgi:hypothetical protein
MDTAPKGFSLAVPPMTHRDAAPWLQLWYGALAYTIVFCLPTLCFVEREHRLCVYSACLNATTQCRSQVRAGTGGSGGPGELGGTAAGFLRVNTL